MKTPGSVKRVFRAIPKDGWPDTDQEMISYWLSKPPRERVEAAREFLPALYSRLHRPWPTRIAAVFRPFQPEK